MHSQKTDRSGSVITNGLNEVGVAVPHAKIVRALNLDGFRDNIQRAGAIGFTF
jgi:hypothetical protein